MHELPSDGRRGSQGPQPESERIPLARSADIARRRRIYTIQMAIRLVCVLAMPIVPGWWKAVALLGAVVLPYTAVLMANDHATSTPTGARSWTPEPPPGAPQITAAPTPSGPARTIRVEDDGQVSIIEEDAPAGDDGTGTPDADPGDRDAGR